MTYTDIIVLIAALAQIVAAVAEIIDAMRGPPS